VLKDRLAGARKDKEGSEHADNMMKQIISLQTGAALVFAPTAVLDVDGDMVKTIGGDYVEIIVRERITLDGGKSKMASDKVGMKKHVLLPPPVLKRPFSRVLKDLGLDNSRSKKPASAGNAASMGSRTVHPQSMASNSVKATITPSEQASDQNTTTQSSAAVPVAFPQALSTQQEKKRIEKQRIENALRTHTVRQLDRHSTRISVSNVRRRVVNEMGLEPKYFTGHVAVWSDKIIGEEASTYAATRGIPTAMHSTK